MMPTSTAFYCPLPPFQNIYFTPNCARQRDKVSIDLSRWKMQLGLKYMF